MRCLGTNDLTNLFYDLVDGSLTGKNQYILNNYQILSNPCMYVVRVMKAIQKRTSLLDRLDASLLYRRISFVASFLLETVLYYADYAKDFLLAFKLAEMSGSADGELIYIPEFQFASSH